MKHRCAATILAVSMALFIMPFTANAQEITPQPICFNVINEAPYNVTGSIVTNYYTRPDGIRARHRSNFRLNAAGTKHEEGYPIDRAEFCAAGPFYPDRKLEFVIRTLVPIFSCITKIDQGPIVIKGYRDEEGSAHTSAICYE